MMKNKKGGVMLMKKREIKKIYMSDIKIKNIAGVEYDEILGWAGNAEDVTVAYKLDGKERRITVESGAVEIEVDV